MQSWRKDDAVLASLCSGRLLRQALCGVILAATFASAQSSQEKLVAKKAAGHRMNELSLAGLRPGRDTLTRAALLNKQFGEGKERPADQTVWLDMCRDLSLTIDSGKERRVEVIRVGAYSGSTADCSVTLPSPWRTGQGLRVGDPAAKLIQLYGPPDSKSPSTRDGQPLELWYYAFDWAGPDVPQVMEVLCTREKEGQPGRVVEITLAAPSL
jgi:hypothetical protein